MAMAYILLISVIGSEDDILEDLKDIPEVKETFKVYGVYDIILKVEADTMDNLKETISKIRTMENVRSTISMIVI